MMGIRGILALTFAGKAFSVIAFVIVSALLVRVLTPTDVGLFFLAMSWVGFLSLLSQAGLNQTVFRNTVEDGECDLVFAICRLVLIVAAFIGALNFLIGYGLNSFPSWGGSHYTSDQYFAMSAWVIAAALQSITGEIFRAQLYNLRAVLLGAPGGVLGGTLNLVIVILFLAVATAAKWHIGLGGLFSLMAVSQLFCAMVSFVALRRSSAVKIKVTVHDLVADKAISFSLIGSGLVTYLLAQSDVWLINVIAPSAIASYAIASSLVKYVSAANILIYASIPALVARLSSNADSSELSRILGKTASISFASAMIVASMIAFFGRYFIIKLYGEAYAASYEILVILSIGHVVNSFVGNPLLVAISRGADRFVLMWNVFTFCFAFAFAAILGQIAGVYGVASAFSAAYALNGVILAAYVKRRLGVSSFARWKGNNVCC